MVSLISQLVNGDTAKSSSEPVSNEDSNSVEVEKPTLDTGQDSNDGKQDSEDKSAQMEEEEEEVETKISENSRNIAEENASEDANLPDESLKTPEVEEKTDEVQEASTTTVEDENPSTNGEELTNLEEEIPSEEVEEANIEEISKEIEGEKEEEEEEEEEIKQNPEDDGDENALNLCSKDLSSVSEERKDEKSCLDLSVKSAPCLRIKPITELMAQPQKKDFAGIKGKYIRGEHVDKNLMYPNPTHCGKAVQSASYDAICYKRSMQEDIYSAPTNLKHPRFDRPTLLGNKNYISYLNDQDDDVDDEEEMDDEELEEDEEIEEPLMLVQGEGSGFPNQSINRSEDSSPIVGEEIEETVMIVRGEGNGEDCDTGNKFETDSEGNDATQSKERSDRAKDKPPPNLPEKHPEKIPNADSNNSVENVLDNNKSEETSSNSDDVSKNAKESFNSPIKQNFFFGNSFTPNTSPLKTASLSFGASTVPVDTPTKTSDASPPPDENHCCSEKTDEIVESDLSKITKVPENVDNIENVDNNKSETREKLSALEEEDCVSDDERKCEANVKDAQSDCISAKCEVGTSEEVTNSDDGDVKDETVLTNRTEEGSEVEIESNNLETSPEPSKVFESVDLSENIDSKAENLENVEVDAENHLKSDATENKAVIDDSTEEESLKNQDNLDSKQAECSEIDEATAVEESTHKESSNEEYDTHTEEISTEIDSIDKNESSPPVTLAEENLIDERAEDVPSSTIDAESPLDGVKDCIEEKIEDKIDNENKSAADAEESNDILEEIHKENDTVVETLSSNEIDEGKDSIFEENQNKIDSETIEESVAEETRDTNHVANDTANQTITDVNEECSKETNNDLETVVNEGVIEDLSSANEITQNEEKLSEILPTVDNEEERPNNEEENNVVKEDSNKVDSPTKGVEIEDEDSMGNSIPDMGHSDHDDSEEETIKENDENVDETDSKNEIICEQKEDVSKIPVDCAATEKEEIPDSKIAGDHIEIGENDKMISLEEEKCGKDSNIDKIEESIVKDKEENLDKVENVETMKTSEDKSIEGGTVGEDSILDAGESISQKIEEKIEDGIKESESKASDNVIDDKESKTVENTVESIPEKNLPISDDAPPLNDNPTNNESTPPIIVINDDDANDTGIEAIKAIKITNVQAKCEMPEQIKVEVDQDATANKIAPPTKGEAPKPQPLRFLRGRRPNQMLSVKSYATRNKNLVLRKEIKPPPVQIEEKSNNTMNNSDDPLLKIIKSEDATEMPTRRSTRRKPADSVEKPPVVPQIVPVEVTKRGRGRQRKIIQPEVDSKRLRLSNNKISEAADLETIDLTSESDGRKISVKNCDESILLKGGITINPVFNNDTKKNNGPFLSCVNIQKLKENPPDHVESPLSVASSGGGDNSDVVIIEDDPLAVPDPFNAVSTVKPPMTLNSLQFDVDPPSPPSTIITRSLRKRGITEPEIVVPSGGKRRKTKGKRQVDLELRRSIEEQKKQEVSSSSEEDKVSTKRKPQGFKKKPDTPPIVPAAPVKKPRAQRKKTLLGLDVPEVLEELNTTISSVRQSRRIAQLKIKEEAERRKLEEITTADNNKEQKRKGKKNIDKDYKAEKRKRPKPPTEEEEVTVDVPEVEEKKTKRKRRRKDRDPRKIFDESNPWRSSSDSSSSNDDVEEEEEEIAEYSDAESPLFKSDHEFSPESDIEDAEGAALPLKRARTARKEDEDIEDDTDDHACQKCGKTDHPEWILLCDGCDNGWHCSCLRPALFIIPEGDWFCPPCQHNSLVKQLEDKLVEYDKKMAKREIEVRRKERLAYVGISLANVLPVKDGEEKRKKKEEKSEDEEEEESASGQSDSSTESSSSSDSDEPIYQLRQRRQAHSYRFNDYDELINSAIQDEMEAVKGAGNQGRGKDISTIVNAEKEEMENNKEKEPEEPPPVVPQESKELPPAVVPPTHDNDSEEEKIVKPVKKFIGRKKQRKLNSLDVSSGDDPDSDEDFKGSSSEEEDEDDFEEELGSDSSEAYGRRRKGMPVRRSTRARTSRYDKDFINDDSEDEELPRKKKSRSIWDESESEESDRSWGRSSRRKSKRSSGSKKKRSKKSKKNFDDSDEDRSKKKKRRIKYGGLNDDDDEEEEIGGRRTRGKKINYADVLASDSDDEIKKRAPPRIESDDDYVANEEEQEEQDEEDFEKEESAEEDKGESQKKDDEEQTEKTLETENVEESKQSDPTPAPPPILPEVEKPVEINATIEQENFDLDNLNSSIDDLPDDLDNDDDDGLNPIEEINKNLEEMDEEEMEKLMEEEEYANKQLQLMAMQLEKEKKRREREAKKKEMALTTATPPVEKSPKKRGRKNKQADTSPNSNVVQIGALQVGPDMQSNPELSEPPGITIPIFSEIPPPIEASPKKRRGRGKGKKTLEKEAAAAAAAAGCIPPPASTTPSTIASDTETAHIPTTVDTVANINEDLSLANAAALHGAKLAVAAPPQPFSQTQPTPSVITRMLQAQPGQGNYSPMNVGHNYYADQPPQHAENPAQVVANAQMPVGNNLGPPGSHNQQLSPMSQPQQQFMHGELFRIYNL